MLGSRLPQSPTHKYTLHISKPPRQSLDPPLTPCPPQHDSHCTLYPWVPSCSLTISTIGSCFPTRPCSVYFSLLWTPRVPWLFLLSNAQSNLNHTMGSHVGSFFVTSSLNRTPLTWSVSYNLARWVNPIPSDKVS